VTATVRFVRPSPSHLPGLGAAVTERAGGVSSGAFSSLNLGRSTADEPARVRENEQAVLQALSLPDRVARLRLEHGARVLPVDAAGLHGPADALVTDRPDLVLWLTVADCLPLVLAAGRWRGLGHCGWRGIDAGIAEALTATLTRLSGARTASLRAWIGPGIGPCCYPVGEDVARRFPSSHLSSADGTPRVDLKVELRRRLLQAGLKEDAIGVSPECTACEPARFFSHRRDGLPSGRMAALCWDEQALSPRP